MPDFTVRKRGVDSSGRGIYATDYMWDWWQGVLAALDFTPTVVQGAFMVRNGGGATESAGYHDAGGCFDVRTWNLTANQLETLVRTLRQHGAAAWRRDAHHGGMDPHLHFVLGTDVPLARGAASQWQAYIQGRDGLASNGPDYEWRPDPLVLEPGDADMPLSDVDLAKIRAVVHEEVNGILAASVPGESGKLTVSKVLERLGKAFDRNGKPKS